jgi:3-oxoacyl-[acyl-carrier-protein] synthase-3
MAPYLADPFRGAVERRVLEPGQTSLDLECAAAKAALDAGGFGPGDVDLVMVCSMRSEGHGIGNGAWLVARLELDCPSLNFETTCSSSVVGFHTACDLVRSGHSRRILVVVSCCYTRDIDEADSFSWFVGDGAGAFVVEAARDDREGLLGHHTLSTHETCGAFAYQPSPEEGGSGIRICPGAGVGRTLRETAEPFLRTCVEGALARAGVAREEIDLFVVNTPTAWYSAFAAEVLGREPGKVVNAYPRYANVGPALMPVNLHLAVQEERVAPGDLVLVYSVGCVGTASAAVFRWGPVGVRDVVDVG